MAIRETPLFAADMDGAARSIVDEIEELVLEPSATEVAVEVIRRHLEKEAGNRGVGWVKPDDLCPTQRRNMVKDLKRLLNT